MNLLAEVVQMSGFIKSLNIFCISETSICTCSNKFWSVQKYLFMFLHLEIPCIIMFCFYFVIFDIIFFNHDIL